MIHPDGWELYHNLFISFPRNINVFFLSEEYFTIKNEEKSNKREAQK